MTKLPEDFLERMDIGTIPTHGRVKVPPDLFVHNAGLLADLLIKPPESLVVLSAPTGFVVKVLPDGSIEFGPGFTVEGAARHTALIFWSMVGGYLQELKEKNNGEQRS